MLDGYARGLILFPMDQGSEVMGCEVRRATLSDFEAMAYPDFL
jgi:hypothetical protein